IPLLLEAQLGRRLGRKAVQNKMHIILQEPSSYDPIFIVPSPHKTRQVAARGPRRLGKGRYKESTFARPGERDDGVLMLQIPMAGSARDAGPTKRRDVPGSSCPRRDPQAFQRDSQRDQSGEELLQCPFDRIGGEWSLPMHRPRRGAQEVKAGNSTERLLCFLCWAAPRTRGNPFCEKQITVIRPNHDGTESSRPTPSKVRPSFEVVEHLDGPECWF
ncbi:hypothetical protein FDECE_15214, partial [Fusarium decemcellulare]